MFVNDGQEHIGTSEWRLSSEPCAYALNAGRGVGCAHRGHNPVFISSRVSLSLEGILSLKDKHNSCLGRNTSC